MDLEKIRKRVEKILDGLGIEVYHVGNPIVDNREYLEIVLRRTPPLSLEEIETLTPSICDNLDDITPDRQFYIDIFSPQVFCPLYTLEHYRQVIGEKVRIVAKGEEIRGTLREVDEQRVVLEKKKGTVEIKWAEIESAETGGNEK